MYSSSRSIYHRPLSLFLVCLLSLILLPTAFAIKFQLPAYYYPPKKCIWNHAHSNTLVIVTANVGPGANQRTDVEIVDSSPKRNVYLNKRNIKGETRLAITTHEEGEVGVCLSNYLEHGEWNAFVLNDSKRVSNRLQFRLSGKHF